MKRYIKISIKRIRSHKRHFQLLELMVAIFILLVCIAPTMKIFTAMYKAQANVIRENQRDHFAHRIHAEWTEQLYKRQILLDDQKTQSISISDELKDELRKISYDYQGKFTIAQKHIPRDSQKPDKYLGELIIEMKDLTYKSQDNEENRIKDPSKTTYHYFVYIDQGAKEKRENKAESNTHSSTEHSEREQNGRTPIGTSHSLKGNLK